MAFTINPPNAPIGIAMVNGNRVSVAINPDWYRFLARLQKVLGNEVVSEIQSAELITYASNGTLLNERVLAATTGISLALSPTNATLTLTNSGVSAGSYGSSSQVATFSVDAQGRITLASNVTITPSAIGAVPTGRTVSAGAGLAGGGDLTADRSLSLDTSSSRNVDHATVSINAGAGLTGGGDITASRSLALATSGVSAGTYASPTSITVDAYGRITAIS